MFKVRRRPLVAALFLLCGGTAVAHVAVPPLPPEVDAWPTPAPIKHKTTCDHGATVEKAALPDYPKVAHDLGLGRVVSHVEVAVDALGSVKRLAIYKSAGTYAVDAVAIRVARSSTYAPAKRKCQAVPGTVLFHVGFNPS